MIFVRDPVETEVRRVLEALASGQDPHELESKHVDLKEEAGRHARDGVRRSGGTTNEAAAQQLAGEAACMANTDGGGALIVGAADDGELIGSELDTEWLRRRIYELTDRRLTVAVSEVTVRGVRLLIVRSVQAIDPVRYKGRIHWRVDDRCVEIDAATWHDRRMSRERYDWSAQSSFVEMREARPEALRIARRFLNESGDTRAASLAAATDADLLRRLNAVTGDGYLTNAGALAFVGRGEPALDYMRRAVRGGDSVRRLRERGTSLLEEFARVEEAADLANEIRHVQHGFVVGQLRELPPRAIREAIVNGLAHRDWASASPTVVEHIGRSLVVSSPGGFVGGVTPANIITHPSEPRNRALAELLASIRLSEREGIGVDRMFADMVALGYGPPEITEIPGPYVRVALVGDSLDLAWIRLLSRLEPPGVRENVSSLLLLRQLVEHRWVDVERAAPVLQLDHTEALGAIRHLAEVTLDGASVVQLVSGVPDGSPDAWRLSPAVTRALADEDAAADRRRRAPSRRAIALDWARARGRVSTTELASIVGASPTNVNSVLRGLEEEGQLEPSRPTRGGRGFFYRPVLSDATKESP